MTEVYRLSSSKKESIARLPFPLGGGACAAGSGDLVYCKHTMRPMKLVLDYKIAH